MRFPKTHWPRPWHTVAGLLSVLLVIVSVALLLLSRSHPWFIGMKNEPHWSWAVGSGRLKVWVAEPGVFRPGDDWTNSWYRGLDGQPIRWDFTIHRGSTGGVLVFAVPLWIPCLFGLLGWSLWFVEQRHPGSYNNSVLSP